MQFQLDEAQISNQYIMHWLSFKGMDRLHVVYLTTLQRKLH